MLLFIPFFDIILFLNQFFRICQKDVKTILDYPCKEMKIYYLKVPDNKVPKVPKVPIPLKSRKYLMATSFLFFLPIFLDSPPTFLRIMSFLTGCASLNFWYYGDYNWRLLLDKFVAYSTSVCYYSVAIHQAVTGIVKGPMIFLYIMITMFVGKALSMSYEKWGKGCPTWVIYHMLFHLFVATGKMVVLLNSLKN